MVVSHAEWRLVHRRARHVERSRSEDLFVRARRGRGMKRLPPVAGEWIDRSQPLDFLFEGERYLGLRGDTLASALAANGVHMVGRSFKYHRPRGLFSVANHDVNAMFQVQDAHGTVPNVRGDAELLRAGMHVTAV